MNGKGRVLKHWVAASVRLRMRAIITTRCSKSKTV